MKPIEFNFSVTDDRDLARIEQRVFDLMNQDAPKASSITVILCEFKSSQGRKSVYTAFLEVGQVAESDDQQVPHLLKNLAMSVARYIVEQGVNGQIGFSCARAIVGFQGPHLSMFAEGESQGLQIWPCGYHSRCSTGGCQDLASVILRKITPGGTLGEQSEHCDEHLRELMKKARRAGVAVHDIR
jgi:hypothetical protein